MMTYSFREQLARGEQGEAVLDAYFGQRWHVARASPRDQRRGIDRWFTGQAHPSRRVAVEYKTDHHGILVPLAEL